MSEQMHGEERFAVVKKMPSCDGTYQYAGQVVRRLLNYGASEGFEVLPKIQEAHPGEELGVYDRVEHAFVEPPQDTTKE